MASCQLPQYHHTWAVTLFSSTGEEGHFWLVYYNRGQGDKGRGELDVSGETKEEMNFCENSYPTCFKCSVCAKSIALALLGAILTPVAVCTCVPDVPGTGGPSQTSSPRVCSSPPRGGGTEPKIRLPTGLLIPVLPESASWQGGSVMGTQRGQSLASTQIWQDPGIWGATPPKQRLAVSHDLTQEVQVTRSRAGEQGAPGLLVPQS